MYRIIKSADDQKLTSKVQEIQKWGGTILGGIVIGFESVPNLKTGRMKKVQMFYQAVDTVNEDPNINLGDFELEVPVENTNDTFEL